MKTLTRVCLARWPLRRARRPQQPSTPALPGPGRWIRRQLAACSTQPIGSLAWMAVFRAGRLFWDGPPPQLTAHFKTESRLAPRARPHQQRRERGRRSTVLLPRYGEHTLQETTFGATAQVPVFREPVVHPFIGIGAESSRTARRRRVAGSGSSVAGCPGPDPADGCPPSTASMSVVARDGRFSSTCHTRFLRHEYEPRVRRRALASSGRAASASTSEEARHESIRCSDRHRAGHVDGRRPCPAQRQATASLGGRSRRSSTRHRRRRPPADGHHFKARSWAHESAMAVQRRTRVPVAIEQVPTTRLRRCRGGAGLAFSGGKIAGIAIGSAGARDRRAVLIILATVD